MGIRQAFFCWMVPAAFVLPAWLLIGFIVFRANAWGIFWLLLIAMPVVFIGQLIFTLMVRSRPSVRASRAVSWMDVGVIGVWQLLTIGVGLFNSFFWLFLTLAVVAFVAVIASCLWQLWHEATGIVPAMRAQAATFGARGADPLVDENAFGRAPKAPANDSDVFIVTEKPTS